MNNYFHGLAYYLDNAGRWHYAQNDQRVPDATTYVDGDGMVTMNAPELLAHQMLDTAGVAKFLGLEHKSVSRMLSRGDIPQPQVRIGKSPLWSRPVLELWKKTRPGKGANLRRSVVQ